MRTRRMTLYGVVCVFSFFIFEFNSNAASKYRHDQPPVSVTILHTNDLHSHFREDSDPLKLGGVARLKTAISKYRKEIPNTLLVDAGDWSEGNIYYNEGGGIETLRMMDHLGYDLAVIGNHDFINGADHLLNTIAIAQPRMKFIGANFSLDSYDRSDEFKKLILPYVIKEIGSVKIAFVGMTTYEHIYDKFVSPILITDPYSLAQKMASELKQHVDAVVVVSHNTTTNNQKLLREAPDVDLVISGHEHKKLTKPIEVQREFGSPGWVVETECWGKYLGKLDLSISSHGLKIVNYELIQIDSRIPNDSVTLEMVEQLEAVLEKRSGPIFHDHVGESRLKIGRRGVENLMGDLVTDAYLEATHADLAMESIQFIYGGLNHGQLTSAEIFNANPAVFNPLTGKAWTVKTIPISGRILKWLLYLAYATQKLSSYGFLSVSGMSFIYDPLFFQADRNDDLWNRFLPEENGFYFSTHALPVVKEILVHGKPIDMDTKYLIATGGGLIEAIEFIDKNIMNIIPLDDLHDTGRENWRVLADYIESKTPLDDSKISYGNRVRTQQSDLGVRYDDVQWEPIQRVNNGMYAKVKVRVTNYGATQSPTAIFSKKPRILLLMNKNGIETGIEPDYQELAAKPLPSLIPGQSTILDWNVTLPETMGLYQVTVRIEENQLEVNRTNNEVTRWFKASE